MKIVNEKGKLFGLINVVDLVFLLVIVIGLVGVGWKLGGSYVKEHFGTQANMTVTLRVRAALPTLVNEFKNSDLTGSYLVAGNEYLDAKITNVSYAPSRSYVTTADGRIVLAEDPDRQDVIITVVTPTAKDTAMPKIGVQEVRAGRTMTFKTQLIEAIANIDSVVIK